MEGNEDFESAFNLIDLSGTGFISFADVKDFYEKIFELKIHNELVKFAINCYEKSESCSRQNFKSVLMKLEECRYKEEECYWDFSSLTEAGTVTIKNALFLARNIEGGEFSASKWQEWLSCRKDSKLTISWQEFQGYLYYIPKGTSETENFAQQYGNAILHENEVIATEYNDLKRDLEMDEDFAEELKEQKKTHRSGVEYESGRLVNRWNQAGLEAVIYDDGEEWEAAPVQEKKKTITDSVTLSQILSTVTDKYELLRRQLLREMAAHSDSNNTDSIYIELLEKEKEARKKKTFDSFKSDKADQLSFKFNVFGLMGHNMEEAESVWKQTEMRFAALKEEGLSTEKINKMFEEEIGKQIIGEFTAVDILQDLYKREDEEKSLFSVKLQKLEDSEYRKMLIYTALKRQCKRINLDEFSFVGAASSVALSERQQLSDFERYNPDKIRQERLADERIKHFLHANDLGMSSMDIDSVSIGSPIVQQLLMLSNAVFNKHLKELQASLEWLNPGTLNESQHAELGSATISEVITKRRQLKRQCEVLSKEIETDNNANNSAEYLRLLKQGSILLAEDMKRNDGFTSLQEAGKNIFSQIQTLQDVEYKDIFTTIESRQPNSTDINDLLQKLKQQLYNNIQTVIFASIRKTIEEQNLISLILEKYDALREKIFTAYNEKHNKEGVDKNGLLEKLRNGEKKNRDDGNHAKLARLCKNTFKIGYPVQDLIGPDMSSFEMTCQNGFLRLEDSARTTIKIAEEEYMLNDDPTAADGNLLSQLHTRFQDEVKTVLESIWLKDVEQQPFSILAEIIWLKWQMMASSIDQSFPNSTLNIGLKERMKLGQGKIKLKGDNGRYIQIAQERFNSSTPLKLPLQSQTKSSSADTALKKVLGCHINEWRRLNELLLDESLEELREAAIVMTEDERTTRLAEINNKRRKLDVESSDWQEDMTALLEEAASLKHVARKELMKKVFGEEKASEISDKDIMISIMADLQEEHDLDGVRWFNRAVQDPQNVSSIKDGVVEESKMATNIFNVLCKYEGSADDDELIQALEDKYDALRDKLLAEFLMKQLGKKRWQEMSEKERQKMLLKLKLEEKRLRKEGDFDALARLLGGHLDDEENLRKLLGLSKEEYERRLRERLANRNRGGADGENMENDLEAQEGGDVLTDLSSRFENERDALLRLLKGQDDRYLSERERQLRLAQLRRESRQMEREENFGAAALVLGLAERNTLHNQRLAADRKRQQELARQRLEALKNRSKDLLLISEEDEEIVTKGEKPALVDAVIKKLEVLYAAERLWMVQILSKQADLESTTTKIRQRDPVDVKNSFSSTEVTDFLNAVHSKLPKTSVSVEKQTNELAEGGLLREALLAHHEEYAKTKEELDVLMLALLQDVHDEASKKIEELLFSMTEEELIEKQKAIVDDVKSFKSSNLLSVLFSTGNSLSEAIKGKYDAILDTLIVNSLKEEFGEDKWNAMLKEEQQRHINEMKEKLKRLIAEGKFEEVEKLVGTKYADLLQSIFGEELENQERERLLKERLERKRQRIIDGMSEEEAQALFDKETAEEEEMLKNRRKNVLENLNYDLDAQRDALLRMKLDGDKRFEEERRRQKELAKLRLQERMFRREQDVDTIAALIALSNTHANQLDKEKERQLALSKLRLEAFKNRKNKKVELDRNPLELPDTDDVAVLVGVVMKELEAKHADERNVLLQMLTDESSWNYRETAKSLTVNARRTKMSELRSLRKQWRNDDAVSMRENQEEHMSMLKEAAALLHEICADDLQETNPNYTDDDLCVAILAMLQHEQTKETNILIDDMPEKNAVVLRVLAQTQWQARVDRWLDNVAATVMQSSNASDNEQVLDAIDEKYDLMKNKLIAEALMKQAGEQAWYAMSEKERQRKIMKMRMEQRKLQSQGRTDEAAALLRQLFDTNDEFAELFGKTKLTQEEALQERLKRRKELIAEREAAGLSTVDEDIENALNKEEENENEKRKNVLLSLEFDMEKEKAALLASLNKHDDYITSERKRQLEIAKIRQQQRQMEKYDQLASIAAIFNAGKVHEAALTSTLESNRERQKALAQERLAERKAKRQSKQKLKEIFDGETIEALLMKVEEEEAKALDENDNFFDHLMKGLEAKHSHARDMYVLLNVAADFDNEQTEAVKNMSEEDLEDEKLEISKARAEWREKRLITALHDFEDDKNDLGKKSRRRKLLAEEIAVQNNSLKKLLIIERELQKRKTNPDNVKEFYKSQTVDWLANLQEAQKMEIDVTTNMVADKDNDVLDMIRRDQLIARKEQWNDNFCKVIANILPPGQAMAQRQQMQREASSSSMKREEKKLDEENEHDMAELENDIEEQKKEIERKKLQGEDIDSDALLAALKAQYAARKKTINETKLRQRAAIQEKLRGRRQARDVEEFEANAAVSMVLMAEKRIQAKKDQEEKAKSQNKSLMQQRLEARRQRRKEIEDEMQEEEEDEQPVIKKPPPRLERQKTMANITISDKERNKIMEEFQRKTEEYQNKQKHIKEKQIQRIQEKIEAEKNKKLNKVKEIISQPSMVREKTITQIERQKTKLQDRLTNIRTEKTQTMKQKSDKNRQDFKDILAPSEAHGLSEDEKMARIAENLQKNFTDQVKQEESSKLLPNDDDDEEKEEPVVKNEDPKDYPEAKLVRQQSRKLTKEEKEAALKKRQFERKQRNKQQEDAATYSS